MIKVGPGPGSTLLQLQPICDCLCVLPTANHVSGCAEVFFQASRAPLPDAPSSQIVAAGAGTLLEKTSSDSASTKRLQKQSQQIQSQSDSDVKSLLAQIVNASEKGCIRVVRDCVQKVEQCLAVNPAKQTRVRGGLAYRPDFMLFSVLLADDLILANKLDGYFFCCVPFFTFVFFFMSS